MKEAIKALNQMIAAGDPVRRSAAVLLLAYLNRDHTDRGLALACAKFLKMERDLWGQI